MSIELKLNLEEVNLVLIALSKQPYEVVHALLPKIKDQADTQLKQAQVTQPAPDPQ